MSNTVDTFLTHNGVKGMKWGVRKELEKKAEASYARAAVGRDKRLAFSVREISEKEYASLSATPIKLSGPNGEFKRVVKDTSGYLRSDMAYVTKDDNNHNTYKALFPPEGNAAHTKKYAMTVTTAKAVVAPGFKTRIDTFIETMDTPIVTPGHSSVVKGRAYVTGFAMTKFEPPELRALSNRELGLKYYQNFAQQQHLNMTLNQAYISNVKKKGYNAIIDDADTGIMSDLSIILFPKESGARVTEVRPISEDELLIAKANLKLPDYRTMKGR